MEEKAEENKLTKNKPKKNESSISWLGERERSIFLDQLVFYLSLAEDLTLPQKYENSREITLILEKIHSLSNYPYEQILNDLINALKSHLESFFEIAKGVHPSSLTEHQVINAKYSLSGAQIVDELLERAYFMFRRFNLQKLLDSKTPVAFLNSEINIARLLIKCTILVHEMRSSTVPDLTLEFDFLDQHSGGYLTKEITETIVPLLDAFIEVQKVVGSIKDIPSADIRILAIRKGSVTVDLTGGIRDTVELVMDLIVPYRRKTKKRQAELDVATKEIEVKQKEADLKKAQATLGADSEQANVGVEKAQVEVALLRQQERELALKNKKQELELFELTLAMVDKIKADLPDSERLYYATKLLDPTRLIATSPLELISAKPIISADGSEGETEDEVAE